MSALPSARVTAITLARQSTRLVTRVPRPVLALALVLTASTVQLSAIVSAGLFASLGATGVSGLRFAIAALVLLVTVRPRLQGRRPQEWLAIGAFGAAMAAMNVCLYLALERLPLGLAITIDFLGPFAVAVLGIRRPRLAVLPALGLIGVALIAGPGGTLDGLGLMFAVASAVGFGLYTILAERIGQQTHGAQVLAWTPTLELMSQGHSDKQIATILGLGLRTVRRRIADAMEALDAPTRFELGVAWARRTAGDQSQ